MFVYVCVYMYKRMYISGDVFIYFYKMVGKVAVGIR